MEQETYQFGVFCDTFALVPSISVHLYTLIVLKVEHGQVLHYSLGL